MRRDAGFSIFYMGINIGALIAPLVCGYLGENINWHYGFGAAGVGMTLGLDPVRARRQIPGTRRASARSGTESDYAAATARFDGRTRSLILAEQRSRSAGFVPFSAEGLSDVFGVILTGIVVVFFVWLI